MNKLAKLTKDSFTIKNEIDETTPVVSNGLIAHYPFKGSLEHFVDFRYTNILVLNYNNIATTTLYETLNMNMQVLLMAGIEAMGNGNTSDGVLSMKKILLKKCIDENIDLVVIDQGYFGIGNGFKDVLRHLSDNGVSCLSISNDAGGDSFLIDSSRSSTAADALAPAITNTLIGLTPSDALPISSDDLCNIVTAVRPGIIPLAQIGDDIYAMMYNGRAPYIHIQTHGVTNCSFWIKILTHLISNSVGNMNMGNCNLTKDGMYVGDPVVNMIENGDFQEGLKNWFAGVLTLDMPYIKLDIISTPWGKGCRLTRDAASIDNGYWPLCYTGSPHIYKADTTYTWSFKYKIVQCSGIPFHVGWWIDDGGAERIHNIPVTSYDLGNGWLYGIAKYTFKSTVSYGATEGGGGGVGFNSSSPGTIVEFADMQLEQTSFANEYTTESRRLGQINLLSNNCGTLENGYFGTPIEQWGTKEIYVKSISSLDAYTGGMISHSFDLKANDCELCIGYALVKSATAETFNIDINFRDYAGGPGLGEGLSNISHSIGAKYRYIYTDIFNYSGKTGTPGLQITSSKKSFIIKDFGIFKVDRRLTTGGNIDKAIVGLEIPNRFKTSNFTITCEVEHNMNSNGYGVEPERFYGLGLWRILPGGFNYKGFSDQIERTSLPNDRKFRLTVMLKSKTNDVNDVYVNSTKIFSDRFIWGDTYVAVKEFLNKITIGSRGNEFGYGFANAKFSNVSLYDRVLTTKELKNLSNEDHDFKIDNNNIKRMLTEVAKPTNGNIPLRIKPNEIICYKLIENENLT